MWKRVLLSVALPALLCAQVGVRRSGGFPFGMQWWDNPVASGLNLTDAQNTQIRAVVREYRSKLIDLRAAEEKAQGDLQDVFNDAPADQRRANEAIDRLGNARGEMTKSISQMSLKMRNILTAEQWQQLRQRMGDRPRGMRTSFDSKRSDGKSEPDFGRMRHQNGPEGPPAGGQPGNAPAPAPPKPAKQ
jgi:Spy/CpxP family protein refolding chaperone